MVLPSSNTHSYLVDNTTLALYVKDLQKHLKEISQSITVIERARLGASCAIGVIGVSGITLTFLKGLNERQSTLEKVQDGLLQSLKEKEDLLLERKGSQDNGTSSYRR